MRKLSLLLALLLCFGVSAAGDYGYKEADMEAEDSSWTISGGPSWADDPGEMELFESGWYVGVETPAIATSWTLSVVYQDLGSETLGVGFRRYFGAERSWYWAGGGVGAVSYEHTNDVRPMLYGEVGVSWTFTDHIGWELVGNVNAIDTIEREELIARYCGSGERTNCHDISIFRNEETDMQFSVGARTGLVIIF